MADEARPWRPRPSASRRDRAGERALGLRVAVLAADHDAAALELARHLGEHRERWEHAQGAGGPPGMAARAPARARASRAARASSNCRTRSAEASAIADFRRLQRRGPVNTHDPAFPSWPAEVADRRPSPYVAPPRAAASARAAAARTTTAFIPCSTRCEGTPPAGWPRCCSASSWSASRSGASATSSARRTAATRWPRSAGTKITMQRGQQRVRRPPAADAAAVRRQSRPPRGREPRAAAAGGRRPVARRLVDAHARDLGLTAADDTVAERSASTHSSRATAGSTATASTFCCAAWA